MPRVYYVGRGKTGSSSILHGFSNTNVAHWHTREYFEQLYGTKLLTNNNYDLYDLIIYIGNTFNFKPTIIECIRNPIDVGISYIFQHIKINRKHKYKCSLCEIKKYKSHNNINAAIEIIKEYLKNTETKKTSYSLRMYKKHFDINLLSSFDKKLNYYFNDTNNVNLLFLKFENIEKWSEIINKHLPYKFVLKHRNKTVDPFYKKVKKQITFTEEEFLPFLDNEHFTSLYSNDEIDKVKKKYINI